MVDGSREPVSHVVGLVYPRRGSYLSAGRVSWPFARATVGEDAVVLEPRGSFGRIAKRVDVPIRDISRVERVTGPRGVRWGAMLRFRIRRAELDGVYIAGSRRKMDHLAEALADRGLPVVQGKTFVRPGTP